MPDTWKVHRRAGAQLRRLSPRITAWPYSGERMCGGRSRWSAGEPRRWPRPRCRSHGDCNPGVFVDPSVARFFPTSPTSTSRRGPCDCASRLRSTRGRENCSAGVFCRLASAKWDCGRLLVFVTGDFFQLAARPANQGARSSWYPYCRNPRPTASPPDSWESDRGGKGFETRHHGQTCCEAPDG